MAICKSVTNETTDKLRPVRGYATLETRVAATVSVAGGPTSGETATMLKKPRQRSWDDIISELRRLQFDVQDVPGVANQRRISRYGSAIVLEKAQNEAGLRMVVRPGVVIGGEIAQLVDRGFQKFFRTSKAEFPATADRLKTLHQFVEELKEVTGSVTLYNEALGTVSDAYLYDRVKGRDLPESERPMPAWDQPENQGTPGG
ncbi:MAG: hypothetical protein WA476_07770 [Acidobacteriaceae bacterium]